jgi:hypothetical protein
MSSLSTEQKISTKSVRLTFDNLSGNQLDYRQRCAKRLNSIKSFDLKLTPD